MLILICDHCGRTFAPDEGLLPGDDCPGDDCPGDDCPGDDTDTPDLPEQPIVECDLAKLDELKATIQAAGGRVL